MPAVRRGPKKSPFKQKVRNTIITKTGSERKADQLYLRVQIQLFKKTGKKPSEKEILREMKRRLGL